MNEKPIFTAWCGEYKDLWRHFKPIKSLGFLYPPLKKYYIYIYVIPEPARSAARVNNLDMRCLFCPRVARRASGQRRELISGERLFIYLFISCMVRGNWNSQFSARPSSTPLDKTNDFLLGIFYKNTDVVKVKVLIHKDYNNIERLEMKESIFKRKYIRH